jgi:hypothetical protein
LQASRSVNIIPEKVLLPPTGAAAMSGTKSLLKAINEAIRQQRWDDAIEAAEDVFQKDPRNYQAYAQSRHLAPAALTYAC